MNEWDKAIQRTPWIYVGDEAIRKLEEIMKAQAQEQEDEEGDQ